MGGVDYAVKLASGRLLLIDLTHSLEGVSKKLQRHFASPLKKLAYPVDVSIDDIPGIPVVIGITPQDLEDLIDTYLRKQLLEEVVTEKQNQVPAFDLLDMLIPQLEHQQEEINRMPDEFFARLGLSRRQANHIYEETWHELEKIKKPLPQTRLKHSGSIVEKLHHPLLTVREKYPEV